MFALDEVSLVRRMRHASRPIFLVRFCLVLLQRCSQVIKVKSQVSELESESTLKSP